MPFKPTDFTQVNHPMNRALVSRALRLLAPERTDRVLDLFCGIGNFTLPLARVAWEVLGIEGSEALTERALENAKANGIEARTSFACRNLFEVTADDVRALGAFDKFLIDPPRDGALAVSRALAEIAESGSGPLPGRIVYVSCNPATLARDADVLVHRAGYRLKGAGVGEYVPAYLARGIDRAVRAGLIRRAAQEKAGFCFISKNRLDSIPDPFPAKPLPETLSSASSDYRQTRPTASAGW